MKQKFVTLLFLLIPLIVNAQKDPFIESWNKDQLDSLKAEWINSIGNDTIHMRISRSLGWYYQEVDRDSSFYFHSIQLNLARKLKLKLWEADALDQGGFVLSQLKNYSLSLQYFIRAFDILENRECEKDIWFLSLFSKENDPHKARLTCLASTFNDISLLYDMTGNAEKRLHYLKSAFETAQDINNVSLIAVNTLNLSLFYLNHNQIDSALKYLKISMNHIQISGYRTYEGDALKRLGEIFVQKKDYKSAKYYFHESISANLAQHNEVSNAATLYDLANLYSIVGNPDSAFYYLHQLLQLTRNINENTLLIKAYADLYTLHKNTGNRDSAYFYLQIYSTLNDSMNRAEKESLNAYQNVAFNQQIEKDAEEKRRLKKENSTRTYFLLAGILVCLIITFLIFRNNVIRKNANQILEFQKSEIEKQKKNIEETLNNLKSTQSQLVQAEKMASLGELTAGIAHEIQNPLNFVNNFAEINTELIDELQQELKAGKTEEAFVISNDIKANEIKINHHGKRADSIVKGMLQHSRQSSGQKELTDINALCDEYLRLSYHGLRAKDKSFNAEFETKFDATLAPINVVPQDIGRVILNLINNAFYAVNARQKMEQDSDYKPLVTLTTSKQGDQVVIEVADNGTGMPDQVKEKIFQPFFTTKPTGEGTGLGLSLSYDIVKAHGGEIKVEATEGEGTEFVILLPITNS